MTELQRTINNLKAILLTGERLLGRIEKAQKDSEKPPPHKWEHGDVLRSMLDTIMICIEETDVGLRVLCISSSCCDFSHDRFTSSEILQKAKFLFNIQEKL